MNSLNHIEPWVIIISAALFLAMIVTAVFFIWMHVVDCKRREMQFANEAEYWQQRITRLKSIE